MMPHFNELTVIKRYKQSVPSPAITVSIPMQSLLAPLPDRPAHGIWSPSALCYTSPEKTSYWYWNVEEDRKMVRQLLDLMAKDPQWVQKQLHVHNDAANGLEDRVQALEKAAQSYSRETAQNCIDVFESFLEKEHERWSSSLFIDLFDPFENELLEFVFGKRLHEIAPKDLQALLLPDDTFLWQERRELNKIRVLFEQGKFQKSPQIMRLLEKHARHFWWIQNSYQTATRVGPDYFLKQLSEKSAPAFWENVARNKAQVLQKYGFDESTTQRLQQAVELTFFRDERKKYALMANQGLIFFFHTIAQKLKIPIEHSDFVIAFCEYKLFIEGDDAFLKELSLRAADGVWAIGSNVPGKFRIETRHARELFHAVEASFLGEQHMYGTIASLGIGVGRAKIVLNLNDFSKFEDGDVLITGMTRPEFVPLMEKAVAIVTDEGGLTCHAAIVSRELGKPCVISTQRATKTFKDNDLVEVNANHGWVRKR